jgi:hypothetical protein
LAGVERSICPNSWCTTLCSRIVMVTFNIGGILCPQFQGRHFHWWCQRPSWQGKL